MSHEQPSHEKEQTHTASAQEKLKELAERIEKSKPINAFVETDETNPLQGTYIGNVTLVSETGNIRTLVTVSDPPLTRENADDQWKVDHSRIKLFGRQLSDYSDFAFTTKEFSNLESGTKHIEVESKNALTGTLRGGYRLLFIEDGNEFRLTLDRPRMVRKTLEDSWELDDQNLMSLGIKNAGDFVVEKFIPQDTSASKETGS